LVLGAAFAVIACVHTGRQRVKVLYAIGSVIVLHAPGRPRNC
jgi:hypothetical protein